MSEAKTELVMAIEAAITLRDLALAAKSQSEHDELLGSLLLATGRIKRAYEFVAPSERTAACEDRSESVSGANPKEPGQ